MRKTVLCAGLLVSLLLTGCSFRPPRVPQPLSPGNKEAVYDLKTFGTDLKKYRDAMAASPPKLDEARPVRDLMINRIITDVQVDYKAYEEKLFKGRALFDTGSDVLGIAVTTAATISNGERVKSILAATATALTGSQLSISKNYFREKTTEILITKMQAARESVRTLIMQKMLLPVDQYTFDEAWSNLVDLYYAGTLQGALLALSQQVGEQAEEARKEAKDADVQRVERFLLPTVTPDEVKQNTLMQLSLARIRNERNVAEARRILTEIGAPPEPNATAQEILDALRARHRAAARDPELRDKLLQALKITP
jgi:hypothetical protein